MRWEMPNGVYGSEQGKACSPTDSSIVLEYVKIGYIEHYDVHLIVTCKRFIRYLDVEIAWASSCGACMTTSASSPVEEEWPMGFQIEAKKEVEMVESNLKSTARPCITLKQHSQLKPPWSALSSSSITIPQWQTSENNQTISPLVTTCFG